MSATEQGINVKAVERIVCAAIRQGLKVMVGKSHAQLINRAVFAEWHLPITKEDQGFWTSSNRFVDREEAFKIAKNADQLNERAVEGQILLYSQDLKGEK